MAAPVSQIETCIYNDILENWGLYARLNGLNKLFFKNKVPFIQEPSKSIMPNEIDAEIAEAALVLMNERNQYLVEWIKCKYYGMVNDYQMAKLFKCGYNKAKQNKVVALTVFGNFYQIQQKSA